MPSSSPKAPGAGWNGGMAAARRLRALADQLPPHHPEAAPAAAVVPTVAEVEAAFQPLEGATRESREAEAQAAQAAAALLGPKLYGFLDVANPSPQALSHSDIDQFNAQGFTPPVQLFSPAEADGIRDYFDAMMAAFAAEGRSPYSILHYHRQCRRLWDICVHPALLDCVEDVLGPDFVLWASHMFCKLPHAETVDGGLDGGVPPHQDAVYWPFHESRSVTVWLAVDDADEQNAAMRFGARQPGSGLLTLPPSPPGPPPSQAPR